MAVFRFVEQAITSLERSVHSAAGTSNDMFIIWLEWPEKCFRVDAKALRHLREWAPKNAQIVRVRSERAFLRALPTATHVLSWHFREEWYARAPRLKVVATPAAGREFVSENAPKGVRVHYGTFQGAFMAESVLGFMLAWARGFFRPELKRLAWPRKELSDKCYTLAGTRAVIAGFGHVGRAIGRRLEANGVTVVGYTRHGLYFGSRGRCAASPCEGDRLRRELARADWFILALPSTTGTDDFLDERLLAHLPRRCVVVNVGRGNAIDEKALYKALRSHRVAGAFLDVRRHEPSATVLGATGFEPRLAQLENCISLPHASAFCADYLKAFIDELVRKGLLS